MYISCYMYISYDKFLLCYIYISHDMYISYYIHISTCSSALAASRCPCCAA